MTATRTMLAAWVVAEVGAATPASADLAPPRLETAPKVRVAVMGQGACDVKAAKATGKALRGAIVRCVGSSTGQLAVTFASSVTGAAQRVRSKGTLPPSVGRCIERRVESAVWPKANLCDLELLVSSTPSHGG